MVNTNEYFYKNIYLKINPKVLCKQINMYFISFANVIDSYEGENPNNDGSEPINKDCAIRSPNVSLTFKLSYLSMFASLSFI